MSSDSWSSTAEHAAVSGDFVPELPKSTLLVLLSRAELCSCAAQAHLHLMAATSAPPWARDSIPISVGRQWLVPSLLGGGLASQSWPRLGVLHCAPTVIKCNCCFSTISEFQGSEILCHSLPVWCPHSNGCQGCVLCAPGCSRRVLEGIHG